MFVHETKVRVRYAETDQMGVVYYGNYAQYFEVGRVEALRSIGFTYKNVEEKGVMMPIAEMHCKYLRPALYDNLLTIRTSIKDMPTNRMVFYTDILNEEGKLLHIGETILAFVDVKTKKAIDAPEFMVEMFKRLFD